MTVVVLQMHSKKMNSLIIGIGTAYKGVFLSVPGQPFPISGEDD